MLNLQTLPRQFFGATLCLLVAAALCLPAHAADKTKTPDSAKPKKPDLVLNNFGDGYRCTLWVNGEPVYASSGFFLRNCNGYPIKRGKNQIRFEAQSLRPDSTVITSAEITTSNAFKSVKATLAKPNLDAAETFLLDANPAEQTILLDDHAASTNEIEQLKRFTLDVAQFTARRDIAGLAKTFRMNPTDVRYSYPRWFSESAKVESSSIAGEKDLDVLQGKRLILIRPSTEYIRASHATLATVKSLEPIAELNISCIVFSKQANAWHCLGPSGEWKNIQQSLSNP